MPSLIAGLNFRRVIYTLIGIWMVVEAVTTQAWPFIFFGLYFTLMGVIGFGCASGSCALPKSRSN